MEVVEFGRLNEKHRVELEGDEVDPFDAAGTPVRWRKKERHVALRGADGRLVASAGLVVAEVRVGEARAMSVVGIGGVIVAATYRGQGLARRTILEALDRAATMGPEVAMLFCHRDRAGLYARLGFQEIASPVLVEQPGGFAEMPMVSMWRALHEGGGLPTGPVTVQGLPF
jgi:predicted N-acetyltransferase YhbS